MEDRQDSALEQVTLALGAVERKRKRDERANGMQSRKMHTRVQSLS